MHGWDWEKTSKKQIDAFDCHFHVLQNKVQLILLYEAELDKT